MWKNTYFLKITGLVKTRPVNGSSRKESNSDQLLFNSEINWQEIDLSKITHRPLLILTIKNYYS